MIATAPFGNTGHASTRLIFGAFAVGFMPQAEADKVLDLLLAHGINHIDTAPSYGDSELRIGPWMRRQRRAFFLATKTGERTYDAAYAEIQQSLERLQVSQIDLLQLHNLVDPGEWTTAMGDGGALQAARDAQARGYVRFIGVTGHGLSVAATHRRSLAQFPFASVLLPFNRNFERNAAYRAEFDALVDDCVARGVAVQTIKAIARGRWGEGPRPFNTWYEPLAAQEDIDAAVAFVLQRPGLFLNTAGDPVLLRRILQAGERFFAGDLPRTAQHLDSLALQPLFAAGEDI